MKKSKRLILLLMICVLVFAGVFAATRIQEKNEQIQASGETVLTVDADSVQSISWTAGEESLAFHKDESWLYDDDEAFPVSADSIQQRLDWFTALSAAFIIDDVQSLSDYGLEEPTCTVTLTTADETITVDFGGLSTIDEQRYFSTGDGKVYLATDDPLDDFGTELSDFIEHDTIPTFGTVTALTLTGEETTTIEKQDTSSSYNEDDLYYCGEIPMDTDLLDEYVEDIEYLTLSDYVSYNATDEELEQYGLNEPDMVATVSYTDDDGNEGTFTLSVARDPSEEEEDSDTVTAYARVGESQILYKISSSSYTRIAAGSAKTLRHQEVFPASFDDIASIEVTVEDDMVYTFTRSEEENDNGEKPFLLNEEEADMSDVESALTSLSAIEFTSDEPTGKEELRLTATLSLDGNPTVELVIYRADGESCLVTVDGSPLALVPRADAIDLVEAINTLVL